MSRRKCVLGCGEKTSLFSFPKEESTRNRWNDFFRGTKLPQGAFVCARHFSEDCFANKAQYDAGFSAKLLLKSGSVPTVKCLNEEPSELAVSSLEPPPAHDEAPETKYSETLSSQQPSTAPQTPVTTRNNTKDVHICPKRKESVGTQFSRLMLSTGTQCFSAVCSKSAATQLAYKTLTHVRSKGTQVRACCETSLWDSNEHNRPIQQVSAPVEDSAPSLCVKPAKRRRVEFQEKDGDISSESGDPWMEPLDIGKTESSCLYNEPKYIVFESCLRELFQTCPVCRQVCEMQQQRLGTFVSFSQSCPDCGYARKWQSQPVKGSTPVGNLQMSAAVYFTGGSFTQVKKVCSAMNLQMFPLDTFKRHSRMFLEPSIVHKWKKEQRELIQHLKQERKITVGGGMKADAAGHSAKFGSYSLVNLQNKNIIDVQLVQSNEVCSSSHMEKEGLRRSLDLLEANSLNVDYIMTDHHAQVKTFLKERKVTQYYDVCHFEKGLSKKLEIVSKKKKCLLVRKWLPAIRKHIYWTAESSDSGPEKVAKWTSLLSHLQNIHKHDDPLFPKCAHPDIDLGDTRKWFQPGSVALLKVQKILMNKRVLCDVENLNQDHQTSSLDAFHSLISHFAPTNEAVPFIGRLCRLYLAAMHYNENAERARDTNEEDKRRTGKTVEKEPSIKYVGDLMKLLFEEVLEDPFTYTEELKQIPFPEDLSGEF